jgi:CheY-like chemotaxis protein
VTVTASPAFPPAFSPASQGRILLVEDDPDAATFFRHVLTSRGGYDVAHTADPALAVTLATRETWDLLLTDLHLPGMTGLELLAAVRLACPALPALMVTAHDPALLRLPCGFPDILLHKPVPAGHLLNAAATLLAGRRRALREFRASGARA